MLVPLDGSVELQFRRSERTPVSIRDSIYPWMKGYALIKSHPYLAKTDASGNFVIKSLPVGKHEFRFWHERLGWLKNTSFKAETTGARGRLALMIQAGENDLGHAPMEPELFAATRRKPVFRKSVKAEH